VLPWHMEKEEPRQKAIKLIAELERHIDALERLSGHNEEIAACKEAIANIKALLAAMQD
jgi:hypothetical protein